MHQGCQLEAAATQPLDYSVMVGNLILRKLWRPIRFIIEAPWWHLLSPNLAASDSINYEDKLISKQTLASLELCSFLFIFDVSFI